VQQKVKLVNLASEFMPIFFYFKIKCLYQAQHFFRNAVTQRRILYTVVHKKRATFIFYAQQQLLL